MSEPVDFDDVELERAVLAHFMAGMGGLPFPLQEYWPGAPGRAYCLEMIRREFGQPAIEYARKLKIFTQH